MARAVIRAKDGTRIEVEGTTQEISKIIADTKKKASKVSEMSSKKGSGNATDFVLQLREEGFFNKPKSLVDIKNKLSESGYIYPVTTLSGVVLKQVRKRNLGRIKEEKKWKYVRR